MDVKSSCHLGWYFIVIPVQIRSILKPKPKASFPLSYDISKLWKVEANMLPPRDLKPANQSQPFKVLYMLHHRAAKHSQRENAIHPLPHKWAYRCPHLTSVTIIDCKGNLNDAILFAQKTQSVLLFWNPSPSWMWYCCDPQNNRNITSSFLFWTPLSCL